MQLGLDKIVSRRHDELLPVTTTAIPNNQVQQCSLYFHYTSVLYIA